MTMSEDFIELLERMNIRVYTLSTGHQLVAQLLDVHETAIEVKAAFEIRQLHIESMICTVLSPYIPFNASESAIIYRSSIAFESSASILLKKKYCDAIVKSKLADFIEDDDSYSPELDDLDEDDYDWSNLKNQYPNRNWDN